ncbi:predicted protein [Naegleria gruberi]|uniref:Cap-specific mRNA (nucleoside-2'-O-)-methyltransferase 1 n=1 Tax=Naegleria gruberi TaxID=5762 RepID=D2V4U8_NAEGR|nr:uncharacterized protein NAEGRDRAFT_46720 [Naegleria gruberi]EFC48164.1 predicted protein [Naegleria gruberi]|eukprot:XP_002680908.1 predicted protein [Naegleria gruberi strain NEG-M]
MQSMYAPSRSNPLVDNDEDDDDHQEEDNSMYDNSGEESNYHHDIFSNDPDFERVSAKSHISNPFTSMVKKNASQKVLMMMEKMGFKVGEGLGKNNQGSASAIELQQQQGRAGLGSNTSAHYSSNLPEHFTIQTHDPDMTDYPYKEDVSWMTCIEPLSENAPEFSIVRPDNTTLDLSASMNNNGQKYVEGNLSPFVNVQQVQQIFDLKSQFDSVDEKIFTDARYRSNPYERIGRSIFQNRAAIKLANIDRISDLTTLVRLPEENGILYFADICAGPGGFTEYLYYRFKTDKAKGWGFTLKNKKDDWKLNRFNPESPHDNFEVNYGEDGTGDITKNENIRALSKAIDQGTNGRGVALVTADGGFSVHGVENSQEYLTHQLVLCQILTGLMITRRGGSFVCKLFDLNTWFSASLMYILYQNYEKVMIVKPLSSRPANSERYVICKGLRKRQPQIVNYLFDVNIRLSNRENIKSLVDCNVIEKDEMFNKYLSDTNTVIAKSQINSLQRIKNAVEDKYLEIQEKQNKIRDQCLQEWRLPNTQTSKHSGSRSNDKNKRKRHDDDNSRPSQMQKSNTYAPQY